MYNATKRLLVLAGCLAAIAVIWVAVYAQSVHDRRQTQSAAEINAANLARAFEEHVLSNVRQIDTLLVLLRDEYQQSPKHFNELLNFYGQHDFDRMIIQVGVIDARGMLTFTNRSRPAAPLYLGDREHFLVHRDSREDSLFISKPVIGRISQKWGIQFTRRLVQRDGTFGGVMVVSIDPEVFANFFRTVDIGRNGVITLVGADRVIRARSTVENYRADAQGATLPPDRPMFDQTRPAAGIYRLPSATDSIMRIWAYRRLPGYPLIVTVALADDEVFAPVRARRMNLIIWGALFSSLFALGAGMYLLLDQRQQRIEGELRDTRQRLELATASGQLGIWDWEVQTDRLVWDIRMLEMYGLTADTFSGCSASFQDALHPDDRAGAVDAIRAAVRGETGFDIDFRIVLPDGTVKTIKADGIVIRDSNGRAVRIIGINRDITERRRLRDDLAVKVTQLESALANVKKLEGIIPICAYCKKIRNDQESWQQMEKYICEHTDAEFSHGICPDCFAKEVSKIQMNSED
jgi:PAS domain S-box-containing protein